MNVVGSDAIAKFIARMTRRSQRAELRDWLARVLPKHMKRSQAMLAPVIGERMLLAELGKKAPRKVVEKMLAIQRAGERLYRFDPSSDAAEDLEIEVSSVLDWLESVPEYDRHLRRIDRMSYLDAVRLSASWHQRLLALSENADDPDVVEEVDLVRRLDDGNRFIELKGPVALLREGKLMGHCVGGRGYVDAVSSGAARIFSLRDAANRPHATIEVRYGFAQQIKGKGNTPPVENWARLIRPFVKDMGWGVGRDGNDIGLVTLTHPDRDQRATFDHPDEVVDFLSDLAPRQGRTLGAVWPQHAMYFVLRRTDLLSRNARLQMLDTLRRLAVVERGDETIVAQGPDGRAIRRLHYAVATPVIEALSIGLLKPDDGDVLEVVGQQVDSLLDMIVATPANLHCIEFAGGGSQRASMLDQVAAFSGRLERLAQVRSLVDSERRKAHSEMTVDIRRRTAPKAVRQAAEDRSWAHEAYQLRSLAPESVSEMRSVYGLGAIL